MPPKKPKHKAVTMWMHGSRVGNVHDYENKALKVYDVKEMNEYLNHKWLEEGVET
ncbi:unnamed protein product, partial [marine sediment metagenome]